MNNYCENWGEPIEYPSIFQNLIRNLTSIKEDSQALDVNFRTKDIFIAAEGAIRLAAKMNTKIEKQAIRIAELEVERRTLITVSREDQINKLKAEIERYEKIINLCDYCKNEYPSCHAKNIKFSGGKGNDNIVKCDNFADGRDLYKEMRKLENKNNQLTIEIRDRNAYVEQLKYNVSILAKELDLSGDLRLKAESHAKELEKENADLISRLHTGEPSDYEAAALREEVAILKAELEKRPEIPKHCQICAFMQWCATDSGYFGECEDWNPKESEEKR